MKKAGYILFLLLFFGCAKSQTGYMGIISQGPNPIPLIIISGESNAGGLAVNADLTPYELAPRASVKILNNTTRGFENLDIGTNNIILHQDIPDNATHGIENGLANYADSGRLGTTPIYILKAGTGTAKIAWYNDSTFIYGGVNAWQQLKSRADTAIQQLTVLNRGRTPPIYLFWTLGLNDNPGIDTAAWKVAQKLFFAKFRQRYGLNVPIFMTRFYGVPLINAKVIEIAAEINDCYSFDTPPRALGNVHWDSGNYKVIALDFINLLNLHYVYR